MRSEDIVTLALLAFVVGLPAMSTGRLRYTHSFLNLPLLLWGTVLLLGVGITLLSPLDHVTKKDALVNGIRLVMALSLFYVVNRYPIPASVKAKAVVNTTVAFSFITTGVALLQMGYWDGWLPINLPDMLVTFREGANTTRGREIFALYVGDTGSHTWSGALAMQALLVWLIGRHARSSWRKMLSWSYFGLLLFVLVRISVRNSILGLFIAIVGLEILRPQRTRDLAFRLLRPMFIFIIVIAILFALFEFAPDSYFVTRVRQAIPRFDNGELMINRASNVYGRFTYWAGAFRMFTDSPLVGQGFYSFRELSEVYIGYIVVHAHNSYVQTFAELGVIGVFALAVLIGTLGIYLARTRRLLYTVRDTDRFWWDLTTGSLVFLAFSMIFANTLWSPNYVAFRMILLGVLASKVKERAL